jgi:hypothetical protein
VFVHKTTLQRPIVQLTLLGHIRQYGRKRFRRRIRIFVGCIEYNSPKLFVANRALGFVGVQPNRAHNAPLTQVSMCAGVQSKQPHCALMATQTSGTLHGKPTGRRAPCFRAAGNVIDARTAIAWKLHWGNPARVRKRQTQIKTPK